jgi:hypothetical protein
MAPLRHILGGLNIILNGEQIKKFTHVLRNTNCLMTCHAERFEVLVSGS